MIDASFIEVPRSRPKDEERKAAEVQSVPPLTPRERQLDFDAKWTKKHSRACLWPYGNCYEQNVSQSERILADQLYDGTHELGVQPDALHQTSKGEVYLNILNEAEK